MQNVIFNVNSQPIYANAIIFPNQRQPISALNFPSPALRGLIYGPRSDIANGKNPRSSSSRQFESNYTNINQSILAGAFFSSRTSRCLFVPAMDGKVRDGKYVEGRLRFSPDVQWAAQ